MKIATVNTRRWHWVLTDAAHQVKTGEILWLLRREKLDILLLSDVHKANSGGLNKSHKTVALEEFVMIVGKMSSMILSPAAQAAWRETERKKQSTLRQPRPRRRTQQQKETERRLVGLLRRLVATRHDGVLFNQCAFPRQAVTRSLLQRATASWALAGALAVRSGFWPSRGRRGGCSRRQSAALTTLGSLMLQETSRTSRRWSGYGLHILQHILQPALHRRALCVRKRLGILRPTENARRRSCSRRSTCPPFSGRSRLCCPCSVQHAPREPWWIHVTLCLTQFPFTKVTLRRTPIFRLDLAGRHRVTGEDPHGARVLLRHHSRT